MISNRKELRECLALEKAWYWKYYTSKNRKLFFRFTHQHEYDIWRYVRLLRICEYLLNSNISGNSLKTLLYWVYERRRNKLGNQLGLCITPNVFGEGLFIDHLGSIVINPFAKVGKNCHIHGDCCIGNTGFANEVPVIGDNVDIGWGAIIRGGVTIADNVCIGANAVVTKSILEKGSVLVGVPAKQLG